MAVDVVSDWGARLVSRIYEQFKTKPQLLALAHDVCGPQFQDLENAFQSLLTLPSIDNSSGAQLDVLGILLDQPRSGVDDNTYRLYLKTKTKADRSSGTTEDVYAVFMALLGPGAQMVLTPRPPAAFDLLIASPITPAQAMVGGTFLQLAKSAGVHTNFEWQEYSDSQMFTFALATGVSLANVPLDTTLKVYSTSGFPASGTITIDGGLSTSETTTYTVVDATTISTSAFLAYSHAVGAEVELVGDTGLGFDNGYFEGAI